MASVTFSRYYPSRTGKPYFELMNKQSTKRILLNSVKRIARSTKFHDTPSVKTGHIHRFKPGDFTVEVKCENGNKRAHAYAFVKMKNPESYREMYHLRGMKKMARDALLAAFEKECDEKGFDRHEH